MTELPKTYDPKQVEDQINKMWQDGGYFHAKPDDRDVSKRFSIVIPPPNVTGALHLGHALNNTLQDILVRWHRMMGHNTLWIPGTDHAGIATQAVVERRLKEEENLSRHDIGRDALVERIWKWKDEYEARIIRQLKLMGCSCDFERTRFTLDEGCSKAVRETFFKLFKDGYIFRGKRLVNWDCELQTAVADDEVYHENVKGKFYHFRYPLQGAADFSPRGRSKADNFHTDCTTAQEHSIPDYLVIATTRPETMLGDTAVAVNPNDERYKHLVGKMVILPLMNREIPIVADEWADPEKGSGCVKITPAHDPNDYEVGQRHSLPMINILNTDGTINENGNSSDGKYKYAGLDRFKAREAVLKDLEELGLVEKIEDYEHEVGHSDRSKTPIEPYLSDQWFLKMDTEITEKTLEAVRNGDVRFVPERYKQSYLDWLGEKRDWCISRQLWWGHRIPVWQKCYNDVSALLHDADKLAALEAIIGSDMSILPPATELELSAEFNETMYIALRNEHTEATEQLSALEFQQDTDVLDTWFSSALWPHSTLGWPAENSELLKYYYPTSVLITSRDIITLWVVRMVLTGLYNLEEKPFHDVYIHPKILDGRGVGMSKSKGNGVDPLDIIDAFGADAMRFGIAAMTTETQDIRMPVSYKCPHCEKLMPQTEKNMFGKDGNPSKILTCKNCKKEFATRWASESDQKDKGLALMVSEKFEATRNFTNKLWNAARFAFMNLNNATPQKLDIKSLPVEDRWILSELSSVIKTVNESLGNYQYSRAALAVKGFFWDSLCDWYLELAKFRVSENKQADEARQILAFVIDQSLRLLHPFVPFITERLWKQLNEIAPNRGIPGLVELHASDVLTVSQFPQKEGYPVLDDNIVLESFRSLKNATRAIRDIRSISGVSPKDRIKVSMKVPAGEIERMKSESHIMKQMAGIEDLIMGSDIEREPGTAVKIVGGINLYIHGAIDDDEAEKVRVTKAIASLEKRIKGMEGKLNNEGYIKSAPEDVVKETRQMLEEAREEKTALASVLELLV